MSFESNPMQGEGTPPAPQAPSLPVGTRRSGRRLGLLMIMIGVLLLVARMIPGVSWVTMWPLIIVAVGFVQAFTPGYRGWGIDRFAEGFGTALIGFVLLGNTTGYVSWGVWWTLLTLWPVLLISIGVRLLGRAAGQEWIRVLGPLMIWGAIFYSVLTAWTGSYGITPLPVLHTTASSETFTLGGEPAGATQTATLDFQGGVGEIRIGSGSALVDVNGNSLFGEPTLDVKRNGTDAEVFVRSGGDRVPILVDGDSNATNLRLSKDVIWDARLQTGACRLDADLSSVPVKRLVLETGASASTIKLGEVPTTVEGATFDISAGAAEVNVLVPKDAPVRIAFDNGLVSSKIPAGYVRTADGWESPNAASAASVWTIHSEAGLGSISVDTY